MTDDYELFVYDGPKLPKMPRYVCMQKPDKILPPNGILEKGAKAIRAYWNNKNLRKRSKK